jgi:hypothetical protein
VWSAGCFQRTSLAVLGLTVYLNHQGRVCPHAALSVRPFTVIDINGPHQVYIAYCDCRTHLPGNSRWQQIMRRGWFPATWKTPRTAFTFDVLNSFHILNLRSKCNMFDFFVALMRKSNNSDLERATVSSTLSYLLRHILTMQQYRYNEFSFVMRIWRHLKLVKRAGRLHDPAGIEATEPRGLVPRCPACPEPGRNLPEDWQTQPNEKQYVVSPTRIPLADMRTRWLYEKIYALDACFKLHMKSGKTKSSATDPELLSGCGVFVNEADYQSLLKTNPKAVEVSSLPCADVSWRRCPSSCFLRKPFLRAAVTSTPSTTRRIARRPRVRRLAGTSRVLAGSSARVMRSLNVSVICSAAKSTYPRTYMSRIRCEYDLHRFINMDFITFDALRDSELKRVSFSYDIYCKWWIHLKKRALANFPPTMTGKFLKMSTRGFVPKLHLYAHGDFCRTRFSLNYHHGVGRTDGESTERDWAEAVLAALQTSEMNAGARHGALDDHWIEKNFRRGLGLSKCMFASNSHYV